MSRFRFMPGDYSDCSCTVVLVIQHFNKVYAVEQGIRKYQLTIIHPGSTLVWVTPLALIEGVVTSLPCNNIKSKYNDWLTRTIYRYLSDFASVSLSGDAALNPSCIMEAHYSYMHCKDSLIGFSLQLITLDIPHTIINHYFTEKKTYLKWIGEGCMGV